MNKVLQNEQLDIQVRFWDENSVQAKTRYFDSQFSLRPNADNLLESLATAIKDLWVGLLKHYLIVDEKHLFMHQISQLHNWGQIMIWLIQLLLIGSEKDANMIFGSES